MSRVKLSELFGDDEYRNLEESWNTSESAEDAIPIPPGVYECDVIEGNLYKSAKNTPGYQIRFRIRSGKFAASTLTYTVWITPRAMEYTKRDLQKLGIDSLAKCEQTLPPGMVARVTVALRKDDSGYESNQVKDFRVSHIEESMPATETQRSFEDFPMIGPPKQPKRGSQQ